MTKQNRDVSTINRYFRSNIIEMSPYAPGEQLNQAGIIKLNTNENPYPPSENVFTAIKDASSRLERYPDPLATSFRNEAAKVWNVSPDSILCGNGSDDILTIITRAFVGDGDWIRFPNPSYILYRTLGHLQNANIEEIAFAKNWSLSDAFFVGRDRLKLIYLPNPNSPTGTMVSREQIVELAERIDCPILVDEAYADFATFNCIDLPARYPNVMVSRTLSKSYALAGLRFGYLVAHPQMIAMLRKVKDSYNTDAIANAAATAAIADQAWLAENVKRCNTTRDRMTIELRKIGFDVIDSHANFVWSKPKVGDSKTLYEKLKANQILVRYMNYANWSDGLRISVGTDEAIDKLLAVLQS
jgi:histidinol-phosphate aminotransferase